MGAEKENRQFKWISGNSGNGPVFPINGSSYGTKAQFERDYNNVSAYLPKEISF